MSLCNEEELERYNKDKIHKMQDTCEKLRAKAEQCEIKKPIINNGYHVCPSKLDCNR